MKKSVLCLMFSLLFLGMYSNSFAHFGMVIPSDSIVMPGESKIITVTTSFSHPMEVVGMEMVKPAQFGVMTGERKQDLLGLLKESKVMGHKAWQVSYKVNRPGVYIFYMEPTPYWEPAEDCYIIHYTKTVISAFGMEEGWDNPVGLKTEIVPLSRPFGLYAGNVFQGIVMVNGKPVPHAEVEVEYYNKDARAVAPTECMVTQVTKADVNGVFTYAVPRAGWWGFSALTTSENKMNYKGQDKDVELGAVIWIRFHNWKEK